MPSFLIKKGDIINIAPKSSSLFTICKKNLYNKYYGKILGSNTSICIHTLISIIYSTIELHYNFVEYKNVYILQYYLH